MCFLKFLPRHTFILDYKWTHYLSSSLASGPNYPKLILVPDKDTGKLAIDLLGQSGARDEGKHNKQQRWAGQFGTMTAAALDRVWNRPSLPSTLCHHPAESLPSANSRYAALSDIDCSHVHVLVFSLGWGCSVQMFPFSASCSEAGNLLSMDFHERIIHRGVNKPVCLLFGFLLSVSLMTFSKDVTFRWNQHC